METHIWWQNNGRRRVVKFCNVEWLGDEIRRIELVEGNSRSRRSLPWLLRHLMGVGHAHCAKLLCHLRDSRGGRRRITRYCWLYLAWVRPIDRLLIHHRLRLRRGCSVGTTGQWLTTQSSIGTRAKLESFTSICSLLFSSSMLGMGSRG